MKRLISPTLAMLLTGLLVSSALHAAPFLLMQDFLGATGGGPPGWSQVNPGAGGTGSPGPGDGRENPRAVTEEAEARVVNPGPTNYPANGAPWAKPGRPAKPY